MILLSSLIIRLIKFFLSHYILSNLLKSLDFLLNVNYYYAINKSMMILKKIIIILFTKSSSSIKSATLYYWYLSLLLIKILLNINYKEFLFLIYSFSIFIIFNDFIFTSIISTRYKCFRYKSFFRSTSSFITCTKSALKIKIYIICYF